MEQRLGQQKFKPGTKVLYEYPEENEGWLCNWQDYQPPHMNWTAHVPKLRAYFFSCLSLMHLLAYGSLGCVRQCTVQQTQTGNDPCGCYSVKMQLPIAGCPLFRHCLIIHITMQQKPEKFRNWVLVTTTKGFVENDRIHSLGSQGYMLFALNSSYKNTCFQDIANIWEVDKFHFCLPREADGCSARGYSLSSYRHGLTQDFADLSPRLFKSLALCINNLMISLCFCTWWKLKCNWCIQNCAVSGAWAWDPAIWAQLLLCMYKLNKLLHCPLVVVKIK